MGQPIAAILPAQSGPDAVRTFVERLYASHTSTGQEMLGALSSGGHNPYRASFGSVRVEDGELIQTVPYTGQVVCGHNPHLFARLVTGLRVGTGTYGDGSPCLEWTERPHPRTLRMPDLRHAAPLEPPDE